MCHVPASDSERRHLSRMAEQGADDVVSPAPGLFAHGERWVALSKTDQHLHIVRALAKKHPTWVFGHFSAAAAYGLSVAWDDLEFVHIVAPAHRKSRSCGRIKRHAAKDEERTCYKGGIPVTSLEKTVFDCLCQLDFKQGLAFADSVLRITGEDRSWLFDLLERYGGKGVRGIRRARKVAAHADGRSESGGESIARAAMIENGYALPELQVKIGDPLDVGRWYRVDYLWSIPGRGYLIGEFDGREKYDNPAMTGGRDAIEVLADERIRESRLSATGIPVMRICYADTCNNARFIKLLDAYGVPRAA